MPFDEEELDPHGECAAEIALLRSALKPFAELIFPQRAEGEYPILPPLPGKEPITVKHVLAAREALRLK